MDNIEELQDALAAEKERELFEQDRREANLALQQVQALNAQEAATKEPGNAKKAYDLAKDLGKDIKIATTAIETAPIWLIAIIVVIIIIFSAVVLSSLSKTLGVNPNQAWSAYKTVKNCGSDNDCFAALREDVSKNINGGKGSEISPRPTKL